MIGLSVSEILQPGFFVTRIVCDVQDRGGGIAYSSSWMQSMQCNLHKDQTKQMEQTNARIIV